MIDYTGLGRSLYDGRAEDVECLVREALAAGRCPREILQDGLIAAMGVVGADFKRHEIYVPEVLMAARAMKAGLTVLGPHLRAGDAGGNGAGVIVIGTVRGDLHDVGKNLVGLLAEGAGFTVHDIGVDQSADRFLAAAERYRPTVVAMSALLTTTMVYMKTVVDRFVAAGLGHVPIVVGGAPVTAAFAGEIGATGHAGNATEAVELFRRLSRVTDALTARPAAPRV